jgi:hypothetical protein
MHGLRHTHVSQLIAAGLDALTISRRIGHVSPSITSTSMGTCLATPMPAPPRSRKPRWRSSTMAFELERATRAAAGPAGGNPGGNSGIVVI